MAFNQSVNRFRAKRGQALANQIRQLADLLGRSIVILDVGGRAEYWENVSVSQVETIDLLNLPGDDVYIPSDSRKEVFRHRVGDARDLSDYPDKSIDLVHSNSVIEHVGNWEDMCSMAREVTRVGKSGWIQTPAWEFPIEPHFHLPFIHWFGAPIRARSLAISPLAVYRSYDPHARRSMVDSVNMLSRREFRLLFPNLDVHTERIIIPKSYVAHWMP